MSHTPAESVTKTEESAEQFFTLWSVFKRSAEVLRSPDAAEDFDALLARLAEGGVTHRGSYDVSAMRADADVMVWLHGPKPEALQQAIRDHTPAFSRNVAPAEWLCVYPFVRSYEWYLLPEEERGKMLRDHGLLGRDFPQVISNTVSSFALGDWEWILGLEAPELVDLVDLMRHLRATEARNHVREEIPFYTGRRITAKEIAEVLT
jgi:chlorite dismutase